MRFVVILLSIIVIIACLALGYSLGNSTFRAVTPPSNTLSQPSPTSTSSDVSVSQHNLIFILADDLASGDPRLESVWLAGLQPGSSLVTLTLIYPSETALQPSQELPSTFSFDSGKISERFLSALAVYPFQFEGYIVSDNPGAIIGINWLGGIDLEEGQGLQDGNAVFNRPDPSLAKRLSFAALSIEINSGHM